MARDRPPSNWSGSSNSDRDFEGRERDGCSTDDSSHDGHVSQSAMPDFSGAGPETNAFLWALEGEADPFSDSPMNTGQQSRQDFYEEDFSDVGDPHPSSQSGFYADGLRNRNAEPEQSSRRSYNHSDVYEDQFGNYPREQQVDGSMQVPSTGPGDIGPSNLQVDHYLQPENNENVVSSRGGFDDEDAPHPSGTSEHIDVFEPSASGQFPERDYDFNHEYSEEQLRLPRRENVDPPHHRDSDQWFKQVNLEVGRDDFDSGPTLNDNRSGIERDVIFDDSRPVRRRILAPDPHDDNDCYQDEVVEEQPRRRESRRPERSHRRAEGYVVEDKPKNKKLPDQVVEIVFLVVPVIVLVLLIRSFVISPFLIPTSSMEPTLEIGDRVLVNKLNYRVGDVARGDIVVVRLDTDAGEKIIIKRAIGLPGETVEIRDNKVIINGNLALEESDYLDDNVVSEDFGPVRVPPDELFLLGDNREVSDDSSKELGPVSVDRVVGRAFVRFWPMGRFGSL